MDNPVLIGHADQLASWDTSHLPQSPRPKDLSRDQPDAHWILLDAAGQAAGQCSTWWRHTPALPGQRVGLIGHYSVAGPEAARRLLHHACGELQRQGCTLAIGPMNGSTWQTYRLITAPGTEPPFFLEPTNPAEWPEDWRASGFETFASYSSRINGDLRHEDERGQQAGARLREAGVRLRALNLGAFPQELERLYPLVSQAFSRSLLYTPLPWARFLEQYLPLQSCLRPELVSIAEDEGRPVGLLFAVPDLLQARRGEVINTSIIKTLVISPARAYAGLGSCLAAHHHAVARELGYQRVIHALMHQSNKSQAISARYGPPCRHYALFAKSL